MRAIWLMVCAAALVGFASVARAGEFAYPAVKLVSPDPAEPGLFGLALAVNETRAVVHGGADRDHPELGSVYVFEVPSGEFLFELERPDGFDGGFFGASLAVNDTHVVVGAGGEAFVYRLSDGAYEYKLSPKGLTIDDSFGFPVAMCDDYVLVSAVGIDLGATNSGAVFVFDARDGALLHRMVPDDPREDYYFGLHLDADGTNAVSGGLDNNGQGAFRRSAYIHDLMTGRQVHKITAPPSTTFFALAISGDRVVFGDPEAGAGGSFSGRAYVYSVEDGSRTHTLEARSPTTLALFGSAVDIDGPDIVVGAPFEALGRTYFIDRNDGEQVVRMDAPDFPFGGEDFGAILDLGGGWLLVGAQSDPGVGVSEGAVYLIPARPERPSDLSGDGCVGGVDLAILIAGWGGDEARLDITRDGAVSSFDLAALLARWGCE